MTSRAVLPPPYHGDMKAHVLTGDAPASHRFRRVLQEELALRCARNPRYSLRAFARYLKLDHSTLSQLLRGRRRFTARTVERIGARLSLTPTVISQFVELERTSPESWRHASFANSRATPRGRLRSGTIRRFSSSLGSRASDQTYDGSRVSSMYRWMRSTSPSPGSR